MVDEDLDKRVDRLYRKQWYENHPDYYRRYRKRNKVRIRVQRSKWLRQNREKRRRYMREYMQQYRKQNKCKQ